MCSVWVKPEAHCFTSLVLKSRYWEIMRFNLIKKSVKFRSAWRLLRVFWNSRGIHPGRPYAASLMPPLWGGRRVANSEVKTIQTSPEALSWQVAPQPALRAVPYVVNGLGCCWWSTECGGGWALPQGRWWLDSRGAQRCWEWPSWEPFELQAAGGMCLVSRSLFSSFLRGEPGESS